MLTPFDEIESNPIAQFDNSFELSEEQNKAIDAVMDFLERSPVRNYFVVSGCAGTGKSSIIPKLRKLIKQKFNLSVPVPVLAYTGKAVTVLMRKGLKDAQTVHSFLYFVKTVKKPDGTVDCKFEFKNRACFDGCYAVIVDEASMIDNVFFERFIELGLKVIYIGDHFQLPPVGDKFNIMEHPDVTLTKVLRQNENNPIVKMATIVRNGDFLPVGRYGNSFHLPIDKLKDEYLPKFDQIITWTNKSRQYVNEKVRHLRGFNDIMPQPDDKMIVKANNRKQMVFNGQIVFAGENITRKFVKNVGTVYRMNYIDEVEKVDAYSQAIGKSYTRTALCTIGWSSEKIEKYRHGLINKEKDCVPLLHLDYGYAITCHSAQGSSWSDVCVLDEQRHRYMDEWYRWMYTAITRAEDRVVIFSEL